MDCRSPVFCERRVALRVLRMLLGNFAKDLIYFDGLPGLRAILNSENLHSQANADRRARKWTSLNYVDEF